MTATESLPGCTQLTHQFFYLLDESNYEALIALFEPDGTWHRQGAVLVGHAQILQALAQRSTTQRIRHVISNCCIASQAQDVAQLAAYLVAYRFDDGALHAGPVPIAGPARLSVLRAALRVKEGIWKVAEMTLTPEFDFVAA